jgi:hypothetical protein
LPPILFPAELLAEAALMKKRSPDTIKFGIKDFQSFKFIDETLEALSLARRVKAGRSTGQRLAAQTRRREAESIRATILARMKANTNLSQAAAARKWLEENEDGWHELSPIERQKKTNSLTRRLRRSGNRGQSLT